MAKKVQYFKVINTKQGHHGFFYKLGLNVDPNPRPLSLVGDCEEGALYFVTAEHLRYWADYGDKIAWITPRSEIKTDGPKFKAHKLEITKMLPFKDALPLIPEIPYESYGVFGVKVTEEMILGNSSLTLGKKFEYLDEFGFSRIKFLLAHKKDKEFLRYVDRLQVDWNAFELKILVENNLWELIHASEVEYMLRLGKKSLVEKVAKKNWNLVWEVVKYL